jgi:hypothetical protein
MARVTRSKKVEIAEDNTALTLEVQNFPLPLIDSEIQPFADVTGNTMPDDQIPVEVQMKDLKAAYREAIGITKKNKKGKSKKKANVQQESEDADPIKCKDARNRADRQDNSEGSLVSRMKRLSIRYDLTRKSEAKVDDSTQHSATVRSAPEAKVIQVREQPIQPPTRATRRQAKAQEGSYDDLLASLLGGKGDPLLVEQHREIGFVTALSAGRQAGPPRSLNNSISALSGSGRTANKTLFLEEALKRALREPTDKEFIDAQATGATVPLQAEPGELKEKVNLGSITHSESSKASR